MSEDRQPTLAVWKFASCDGCQLSLLDCEDELLALADRFEIAYFLEASAARPSRDPTTSRSSRARSPRRTTPSGSSEVRAQSRALITIGACATAGGIQALRNFADVEEFTRIVYASPDYISTLATSTPISAHVPVDFELHGCPINKRQLLEVISAHLNRRRPRIRAHSVCIECKRRGTVCVMVAHGTACLGPVTHAGCGALCPAYDRGCYGCFGPMETPNTRVAGRRWRSWAATSATSCASTAPSTPPAPAVPRSASEAHERELARSAHDPHRLPRPRRGRGRDVRQARRAARSRDVKLRIYEPPRFFEAFLRGRAFTEAPDITARICGICPVAYQMSAVRRWRTPAASRSTRARSAICAGCSTAASGSRATACTSTCCTRRTSSATRAPSRWPATTAEIVEQGLQMKKAGNAVLALVGGREIHPINVRVGGFYRAPRAAELRALVEPLERARETALETVRWAATLPFPDVELAPEHVALRDPAGYPIDRGRIVSDGGLDIAPGRVRRALRRGARRALDRAARASARARHLPDRPAGALQPRLGDAAAARAARPRARPGSDATCRNPFQSIVVRAVELVQAADEALALIDALRASPTRRPSR